TACRMKRWRSRPARPARGGPTGRRGSTAPPRSRARADPPPAQPGSPPATPPSRRVRTRLPAPPPWCRPYVEGATATVDRAATSPLTPPAPPVRSSADVAETRDVDPEGRHDRRDPSEPAGRRVGHRVDNRAGPAHDRVERRGVDECAVGVLLRARG